MTAREEAPMPPQQRMWMSQPGFEQSSPFVTAILLECMDALDVHRIERAMEQLADVHEALAGSFRSEADGDWKLVLRDGHVPLVQYHDLANVPLRQQQLAIQTLVDACRNRLSMHGPVAAAVLIDLGTRGQRLLLMTHHFVTDGWSLRVLLEDLESVLLGDEAGESACLERTGSYADYARAVASYPSTSEGRAELEYWLEMSKRLQRDADPRTVIRSAERISNVSVLVSGAVAELLTNGPMSKGRLRVAHVIQAALSLASAQAFGQCSQVFEWVKHGRRIMDGSLDLSRTIGWIATNVPVVTWIRDQDSIDSALGSAVAAFDGAPNFGCGFQSIYMSNDAVRTLRDRALGTVSYEAAGSLMSPDGPVGVFERSRMWRNAPEGISYFSNLPGRPEPLSIYGSRRADGRVGFDFRYDQSLLSTVVVERLSHTFQLMLERMCGSTTRA